MDISSTQNSDVLRHTPQNRQNDVITSQTPQESVIKGEGDKSMSSGISSPDNISCTSLQQPSEILAPLPHFTTLNPHHHATSHPYYMPHNQNNTSTVPLPGRPTPSLSDWYNVCNTTPQSMGSMGGMSSMSSGISGTPFQGFGYSSAPQFPAGVMI